VPNTTGWTQCSITAVSTAAPTGPPHAISAYTPTPNSTPAAVIEAAGVPVPEGTHTPLPTLTAVPVYNGASYAAQLGTVFSTYNAANFAYDGLCQTITVPAAPTFTLEVYANGNEPAAYFDFDVNLLDTSGNFLVNLWDENVITSTSSGDTAYRTVTIPSSSLTPYIGQTVELFVGIWTKSGSGSNSTSYSGYYFVDYVNLTGSPTGPAAIHRRPVKVIRH
jgi:hypothetical protein